MKTNGKEFIPESVIISLKEAYGTKCKSSGLVFDENYNVINLKSEEDLNPLPISITKIKKKMIKIYRIEHLENGIGIYGQYHLFDDRSKFRYMLRRHNRMPNPYKDNFNCKGHCFTSDEFCAFNSMDEMLKWVTRFECKKLIREGFKIYEIEIDIYVQSKFQTLYKKKDIINKIDITNKFV